MLGKEKFKYNLASIMVIPKTSRAFLSKDLENWQPAFRNEHRINLSYLQKIAAYNRKTDTECSPSDMSKLKKKKKEKKNKLVCVSVLLQIWICQTWFYICETNGL